jgi:hypothetical protein
MNLAVKCRACGHELHIECCNRCGGEVDVKLPEVPGAAGGELTATQLHALKCANASADHSLLVIGRMIEMPPEVRDILKVVLISTQMGAVTQAAQFSANQRAEIARIPGAEVKRFAVEACRR